MDGSELARIIFTSRRGSVQPCVRPISAVHMTIADHRKRTGCEQTAQAAITLFADTAELVSLSPPHSSVAWAQAQSRPKSLVLIGTSWD
jgi:hypothetical protein